MANAIHCAHTSKNFEALLFISPVLNNKDRFTFYEEI